MFFKLATLKNLRYFTMSTSSFSKRIQKMCWFSSIYVFHAQKKQAFFQNFRCLLEIISGDSTRGGVLWFQSGTTVVPGNGLGLWKEVPWMQHAAMVKPTGGSTTSWRWTLFFSGVVRLHKYPPGNEHIPSKDNFEDDFPFPQVGYVIVPRRVVTDIYRTFKQDFYYDLVISSSWQMNWTFLEAEDALEKVESRAFRKIMAEYWLFKQTI